MAPRKSPRLTLWEPSVLKGPEPACRYQRPSLPPSIPPLRTHNKAFGTWEGWERASVCFAMRQRKRFLMGPAQRIHTSQHGCKFVADWESLSCFPGPWLSNQGMPISGLSESGSQSWDATEKLTLPRSLPWDVNAPYVAAECLVSDVRGGWSCLGPGEL